MQGGLLCHPDLLPFMQFSPDILPLAHENSISVKLCEIPRYSILRNRFCFHRPLPRFHPQFHDCRNHRALLNLLDMFPEQFLNVFCSVARCIVLLVGPLPSGKAIAMGGVLDLHGSWVM